jgi:hypothetical protein
MPFLHLCNALEQIKAQCRCMAAVQGSPDRRQGWWHQPAAQTQSKGVLKSSATVLQCSAATIALARHVQRSSCAPSTVQTAQMTPLMPCTPSALQLPACYAPRLQLQVYYRPGHLDIPLPL